MGTIHGHNVARRRQVRRYLYFIRSSRSESTRAQRVTVHTCDRKGELAKVLDESGDEPLTCIYSTML